MYTARRLAVRHARTLEATYGVFQRLLIGIEPLLRRLGYARLEGPVRAVERRVKGLLFDCRMCGRCALGATGMSCPMNCPKQLRNGPCGGVRQDGGCEVHPEMRCVWVEAFEGAGRMRDASRIAVVQPPVDRRLEGSSSWLREVQALAAAARSESTGGEAVHGQVVKLAVPCVARETMVADKVSRR